MQWLLHGTLAGAVGEALRRRGDRTHEPGELSSGTSLLEAANARQWDIITNDPATAASALRHGNRFNRCIVYLQLEGGEVEQDDAVDRLFARYPRLSPGRLYTVTARRVKVRQLK